MIAREVGSARWAMLPQIWAIITQAHGLMRQLVPHASVVQTGRGQAAQNSGD